VLPPEHSWPSEGDRQEALRRGDRLSLPRLQLVPRANCLNCELPFSCGLPGRIVWREPENRPQPKPLFCSARGEITEAECFEIKPLAGLSTTEMGTLPEHAFSAIAIVPAGLKGHRPVLIDYTAVLTIQHLEAEPMDVAAAFLQGLATSRCRLAGFGMGAQKMLNRLWITGSQGEGAVSRPHQLLSRDRQLLARNQWPAAAAVDTTATRASRGLGRGGLSAEAQGCAGHRGLWVGFRSTILVR